MMAKAVVDRFRLHHAKPAIRKIPKVLERQKRKTFAEDVINLKTLQRLAAVRQR